MCIKGFALILRTGSNIGTIPSINGEHPIVKSSVDMGIHVGTGIFLQDTFIFICKLRVERNNIICYWVYYDAYALLINAICLPPPLYASCPRYIALWLVVLHLLRLPQPLHTQIPLFFCNTNFDENPSLSINQAAYPCCSQHQSPSYTI